jgi:hypothetical protein
MCVLILLYIGALAVGARTMQEGGAMLGLTREQVELFCVDHLIMVLALLVLALLVQKYKYWG